MTQPLRLVLLRHGHGEWQFRLWRRSYDAAPPPLTAEAWQLQLDDPRYAMLPPEAQPRGEALRDVSARLLPYWYDAIVPDLLAGGCVLVVSHGNALRALVKHGNALRALVKHLESIPDDQIAGLDIPTGIPLLYELGPDLRPDDLGGQYLDPHVTRRVS